MVSTGDSKSLCLGSNPNRATMRFKYNDKVYETPNLEKKLKRMKITMEDVEILPDVVKVNEDDVPEWKLNGYKRYAYTNNKGMFLMSLYKSQPPLEKTFLNEQWYLHGERE